MAGQSLTETSGRSRGRRSAGAASTGVASRGARRVQLVSRLFGGLLIAVALLRSLSPAVALGELPKPANPSKSERAYIDRKSVV